MAFTVYVDLSAKLEQWTHASAIAMANDDLCRVYLVPSRIKQQARQLIRERYGPTTVQYRLLAILIFLIVRESLAILDHIVIDKDYAGEKAEGTIKNLLLDLIRKEKPDVTAGMIRFENAKGSRADRTAKQVYDGKVQPDHVVKFGEIARLLTK